MFSVIIPWCNRQEIDTALAENHTLFERHDAEVIIVNAGGDGAYLRRAIERSKAAGVRVVTIQGTFNRSLCLNLGALNSRREFLFFLDGDIILKSDLFAQTAEFLRSGRRYATVHRVIDSTPRVRGDNNGPDWSFLEKVVQTKEYLTVDGRRAVITTTSAAGSYAGDGLVLLTKQAMWAVGGLNSRFTGWGFEDTDFQLRLQFLLGLERVSVGEVTHLTHATARTQRLAWRDNLRTATRNYCRGHYLGTMHTDAAEWGEALIVTVVS